jgi:CRP-like cAMP-binding protein
MMDESASANPLTAKLRTIADLSPEDSASLDRLVQDVRDIPSGGTIIDEGDRPTRIHLVLAGWVARMKYLSGGSRQITGLLLPGDFCNLHATILDEMDHSMTALVDAKVAFVAQDLLDDVLFSSRAVTRAFWWSTLLDEAIVRAWLVSVGRRSGLARVAHLFCELQVRLTRVGLATGDTMVVPLTQEQLGDATGLTSVHVNRMLRTLRDAEVIDVYRGRIRIIDSSELRRIAGFDPTYLHGPETGAGKSQHRPRG